MLKEVSTSAMSTAWVIGGVTGVVGYVHGAGWLADKPEPQAIGAGGTPWVLVIAFTLSPSLRWRGILWAAPTWQITMLFLAGPLLLNTMYLAPALAVVQNAVVPARRTMSGAVLLFVLNLVGLGVGPVFVGRIADAMEPAHGKASIAYGFAALIPVVVITIGAHLAAAASIARDKRLAAVL